MDAFVTFGPALRSGEISVQRCELDPDLYLYVDRPIGEPRFTYVRFEQADIAAMAVFVIVQPYEGLPCFQLGYAVAEHLRDKGRAKDVALAAFTEFSHGLKRNGVDSFYIEAVVGAENIASQKVAETVVSLECSEIIEAESNKPALQYLRKVSP